MTDSNDPRLRQIKIKTGVVKRLAKEKESYAKELTDNEKKLVTMKEKAEDEYNIKKMVEIVQESKTMVSDCEKRLTHAYEELKTMLETESELSEHETYRTAQSTLNGVC